MKTILSPIIQLLFLSFALFSALPSYAQDIEYCENLSKQLDRYVDAEAVYQDLVLKARRKATEAVFKRELGAYKRDYFSRQEIIDALLPLVTFDERVEKQSHDQTNAFNVCVRLDNVRAKYSNDKRRFEAKDVAEICHFDGAFVSAQIEVIKQRFIDNLKEGNVSRSVALMLSNPDNLKPQTDEQLKRYFYVREFKTDSNYLSDLRCQALYLYPIDLYVASSAREVSSSVSFLPPVTAEDNSGRKAKIQMIVIHRDYNWEKGSTKKIVKGGKVIEGFKNTFKNPRFVELSDKYLSDVLSLGMASCEGRASKENARAKERGKSVSRWVREAFSESNKEENTNKELGVYTINLGKHRFNGAACKRISPEVSESQRKILLIGVLKGSDLNINLKQVVYNAMRNIAKYQPEKLPINPKDYLRFDVIRP